jgi:hypothetical protein
MNNEKSQSWKVGTFQFSGTQVNTIENSNQSLLVLALDTSYSIERFVNPLRDMVKTILQTCSGNKNPLSDSMMVRLVTFDKTVDEFHGFKEINKCVLTDYDALLNKLGDRTALYDGVANSVASLTKYAEELVAEDYSVNGLLAVLSDGLDNYSSSTPNEIKKLLDGAVGELKLESLVSILVGVNTGEAMVAKHLNDFATTTGMKYIDIKDANETSIAKLANFISKSFLATSSSLGTGKPAASLTF